MNGTLNVGECLAEGARLLGAAGLDDPRREARLILAHALGVESATIIGWPERPVTDPAAYRALIARRAAREPLSHLTGRREFWSLEFEVGPATLDPRPDSETLVEAALDMLADRAAPLALLDFGAGTGCLLLALLSELPAATGLGVDISESALAIARRNARRLGLDGRARFAVGSWGAGIGGHFNLIVSNPPYIASGEIDGLQPEVALHEPRGALDGGPDGLDAYRALAPDLVRLLAPGGAAVLEFGIGQGDSVGGLMARAGLSVEGFAADLSGRRRCVLCRKR